MKVTVLLYFIPNEIYLIHVGVAVYLITKMCSFLKLAEEGFMLFKHFFTQVILVCRLSENSCKIGIKVMKMSLRNAVDISQKGP